MRRRTIPCLLALLTAGLPTSRAQVIPLDATVATYAEAQLDGTPLQYDRTAQEADANFDPINLGADATTTSGDSSADAFTSISAIWDAPEQGSIQFGDTGFATNATGTDGLVDINGTRWTYRFQTTGASQIAFTYQIDFMQGTTDPTGLDGFRVVVILEGYLPVFDQTVPPGNAGVLTVPLDANTGYTVSIVPVAGLSGNLDVRVAGMDANFDWQITSTD
jgi:hypothetical protein